MAFVTWLQRFVQIAQLQDLLQDGELLVIPCEEDARAGAHHDPTRTWARPYMAELEIKFLFAYVQLKLA